MSVANKVLVPADLRPHFSENMAFLPGSYLLNDSSRAIAETVLSRTAMGLPETGLVFCCFNNAFKITPAVFAVWLRILQAVPDSVLWLSVSTAARDNLQNAAVTGGIAAERLVFAERLDDAAEHLARLRLADLFLDTLPYNAHATAVDALWAGLPVLTCAGETFAGRVGASLLTAIELPELITENMQDYEKLAVSLAGNPQYLADLKNKLAANRLTTALFNTPQYARDLENAFLYMHQRCLSGLPAEDFGLSV